MVAQSSPAGDRADADSQPRGLLGELGTDLRREQVADLARHPGRGVDAVGDRADRDLVVVEARPQAGEHPAADLAVQQAHAVGALAEPQAHDRHVEHGRVAALVVLGAEREDPLDRDAGAGVVAAEVLRDQLAREAVDARRAPGVWVVNTVPARAACSASSKVRPCGLDELADALEAEEAGVALVGVEHLGLGRAGDAAERAQGAHAADAEQQLLLQAVLAAAAVEPVGDVALGGVVVLDVGVEHAAAARGRRRRATRAPRSGAAAGQADLDDDGRAVVLAQQRRAAGRRGRGRGRSPAASRRATATA